MKVKDLRIDKGKESDYREVLKEMQPTKTTDDGRLHKCLTLMRWSGPKSMSTKSPT